jgi:hypothetical protein
MDPDFKGQRVVPAKQDAARAFNTFSDWMACKPRRIIIDVSTTAICDAKMTSLPDVTTILLLGYGHSC